MSISTFDQTATCKVKNPDNPSRKTESPEALRNTATHKIWYTVVKTETQLGEFEFMPTLFTPELGDTILGLILPKRWMVCYEFRHNGDPSKQQSMDQVYEQVAETLDIVPRYHLFPRGMPFQAFIMGLSSGKIEPPHVTIEGERRIFFGFGLREDQCFFVTNAIMDSATADREPKPYEFMLDALQTLEPFSVT